MSRGELDNTLDATRVHIVSPSSSGTSLKSYRIKRALAALESNGFAATLDDKALHTNELGLAGSPEERAERVVKALSDTSIELVMSFWGGYNTNSIIDTVVSKLKDKNINSNPVVGYSDFSSLLLALYASGHENVYHGPAFISFTRSPELVSYAADALKIAMNGSAFHYNHPDTFPEEISVVRHGRHTGPAIAANLDTLTSLIGTTHLPSFEDSILFLEEAEYITPQRLYRNMTQLNASGITSKIGMLCMGAFHPKSSISDSQLVTIIEETTPKSLPILKNLAFGHTDPQFTIPYGRTATVDATIDRPTIDFEAVT